MSSFSDSAFLPEHASDRMYASATHQHDRRHSLTQHSGDRSTAFSPIDERNDGHRWSQSTSSSAGSPSKSRRKPSTTKTVGPPWRSENVTSPSRQNKKSKSSFVDYSPRASPQRRPLSPKVPDNSSYAVSSYSSPSSHGGRKDKLSGSLTALPPLYATPALTDPNDLESPSTIQTVPTPSIQPYGSPDYFSSAGEEQISSRNKAARPPVPRNPTAPASIPLAPTVSGTPQMPHAAASNTWDRPRSPGGNHNAESNRGHADAQEISAAGHRRSRTRSRSEKDKKAMLSSALQKANTAVLLDNAQNLEGALEAYNSACDLLQQVMYRTSGADDKRKLEAIRVTYSNRIEELQQLLISQPPVLIEKNLPDRPASPDSPVQQHFVSGVPEDDEAATIAQPTMFGQHLHVTSIPRTAPRLSYPPAGRDSFFSRTMAAVEGSTGDGFNDADDDSEHDASEAQDDDLAAAVQEMSYTGIARTASSGSLASIPGHDRHQRTTSTQDEVRPPPLGHGNYIPRPLSPRRRQTPSAQKATSESWEHGHVQPITSGQDDNAIDPSESNASMSWLDTIDESGSSRSSSVHSISSQLELRRKHIRGLSGETDPDFDAAFDAAVEAAYNEGLEPDLEARRKRLSAYRLGTRQGSTSVVGAEVKGLFANNPSDSIPPFDSTADSDEEEERVLDAITQDLRQNFDFNLQSKSSLPRQSSSSDQSRSTWQSSQASDRITAATSLSTVTEDGAASGISPEIRNAGPWPAASFSPRRGDVSEVESPPLPPGPPPSAPSRPQSAGKHSASGVRGRRMPAQNSTKMLKIETSSNREGHSVSSGFNRPGSPFLEEDEDTAEEELRAGKERSEEGGQLRGELLPLETSPSTVALPSSRMPNLRTTLSDEFEKEGEVQVDEIDRPVTSAGALDHATGGDGGGFLTIDAANRPTLFRKTKSSLSLRSHQEHTLLLASPADFDFSHSAAITPMSSTFMTFAAKRNQNPLISQRANLPALGQTLAEQHFPGGVYLFDTSLSSASGSLSPRSPALSASQPTPLEPCPESTLLRPFWLMRTLALTLTHPRGGFLSTRLFVPREIWQTRGVKLKFLEEKIANCDLLTAALQKLSNVDTYDVEAVEKELQSFEETMEKTQAVLAKKLGNEVGVHGVSSTFRDAPIFTGLRGGGAAGVGGGAASNATSPGANDPLSAGSHDKSSKSNSGGKGGYLSSWRKLRNKSSGAPLTGSDGNSNTSHGGTSGAHHGPNPRIASDKYAASDVMAMPSVPMTGYVPVERRGGKRDQKIWALDGPNREYMNSLARLFDGVQVLDQIARQVEDPGLKHSSPTHVGLELSIRHAAEFFSFYVCRFVLADLGLLIDKFVKKGSEWIMT